MSADQTAGKMFDEVHDNHTRTKRLAVDRYDRGDAAPQLDDVAVVKKAR